ncbi:MAG: hypothetical protein ACE5EY_06665 [Anaerolineae bacterium]
MIAELELEQIQEETKGRSPAQDAFREFRRNKVSVGGALFILLVVIIAVAAPIFTPYHFADQNNFNNREKPMTGYIVTTDQLSDCHWANTPVEWGCTIFFAGSDSLGRDIWSRVVYGGRVSLAVAVVASSVALGIGIV